MHQIFCSTDLNTIVESRKCFQVFCNWLQIGLRSLSAVLQGICPRNWIWIILLIFGDKVGITPHKLQGSKTNKDAWEWDAKKETGRKKGWIYHALSPSKHATLPSVLWSLRSMCGTLWVESPRIPGVQWGRAPCALVSPFSLIISI